jgi:SLT domain-containing protein
LQALKDSKNEEKIIAATNKALDSQREAIKLAQQNLDLTTQTAAYQEQTAKAVYDTKVVQAQMTLESKLTSDNIGMSQQNAVSLSNSLASGVGQAQALSGAMGNVAANANNAASAMQRALAYQKQMQNVPVSSTSTATSKSATYSNGGFYDIKIATPAEIAANQRVGYAKGGYVSKPTNAMIAENGQPEYVVPASKAANFASNYLSGMRGDSAVQSKTASSAASYLAPPRSSSGSSGKAPAISIQTGPVTQMNGVNYVTTQEMARAVQTGVRQTLNMLRNDGSARQAVGMS